MNIENINGYTLNQLNKINIVLGKNGCGKSTLLRNLEQGLSNQPEGYGKTKYITPERGGSLVYQAGIEQSFIENANWLSQARRKNLSIEFRQQSVTQYRRLETLVLREFEEDQTKSKFNPFVDQINSLLDNIEIRRHDTAFKIYLKGTDTELRPEKISSGESELISLGIECLIFCKEITTDKENILFLDEPDVHLHPDLQVRLMHFLRDLVLKYNFRILIATHSTAILGALDSLTFTNLSFMNFDQKELDFKSISEVYRKILPVFGAHPLSNIFNEAPVLLVEGEDDERIWQQVVRSSNSLIKLYPCSVDGIDNMNNYEEEAQKIIQTVYEKAKGYLLRDRDDNFEEISDLPPIVRMRLRCRNAENLLLSDESLELLGITWDQLKERIEIWLETQTSHNHFSTMKGFKDSSYDRKNYDIKQIRNDLIGIIGSEKPWEVTVGQTITKLHWNDDSNFDEDGKMIAFLGEKIVKNLIPKTKNLSLEKQVTEVALK